MIHQNQRGLHLYRATSGRLTGSGLSSHRAATERGLLVPLVSFQPPLRQSQSLLVSLKDAVDDRITLTYMKKEQEAEGKRVIDVLMRDRDRI